MSRYRTVVTSMWSDDKFLALSHDARWLWIYLLTGPHTGALGLSREGRGGLSDALGWDLVRFDAAWDEVASSGMAKSDWDHRIVWVPKVIEYEVVNPPVLAALAEALRDYPSCPLKDEFVAHTLSRIRHSAAMTDSFLRRSSGKGRNKNHRVDTEQYDLPGVSPTVDVGEGKSMVPRIPDPRSQIPEEETTVPGAAPRNLPAEVVKAFNEQVWPLTHDCEAPPAGDPEYKLASQRVKQYGIDAVLAAVARCAEMVQAGEVFKPEQLTVRGLMSASMFAKCLPSRPNRKSSWKTIV